MSATEPAPQRDAGPWCGLLAAAPHPELTRGGIEACVRAIADDLVHAATVPSSALCCDLSLGRGAPGAAVFLAYWAQYLADRAPQAAELAWTASVQLLEHTMTALAARPRPASLYQGYAGAAWAVQHLTDHDDHDAGARDPLLELDAGLLRGLAGVSPCFDLISGLAGVLVYARERGGSSPALMHESIARLVALAQPGDPAGRAYFTPPAQLSAATRPHSPAGHHDLGLAHGGPGVLAAILGVLEDDRITGRIRDEATALVDDAIAWLLRQPVVAEGDGRHPAVLRPGETPRASRLAWCYGDLGIASILVRAGQVRAQSTWIDHGRALVRLAARRDADTCGVVDASLCHGSAGLAHAFARLYALTDEPACLHAAQHWLLDTIARRRPGCGIGGFRYWAGHASRWRDDPGFLEGAAGIGLALLATIDDAPPAWDRLLLLS